MHRAQLPSRDHPEADRRKPSQFQPNRILRRSCIGTCRDKETCARQPSSPPLLAGSGAPPASLSHSPFVTVLHVCSDAAKAELIEAQAAQFGAELGETQQRRRPVRSLSQRLSSAIGR